MATPRKAEPMTPRGSTEKAQTRIYHRFDAAFRVWGQDADIERLSEATGLKPSESHRKGDRRGKGKWEDTMWSIRSKCPETADLETHLSALLDALEPLKRRLLAAIPARSQGIFWCAHYTNAPLGMAGTVRLSPQVLSRLARFGFEFSLDTYSDCR